MPEHSPKPKQLNQEEVAVKAPDSIESLRAAIQEKEEEARNPESGKNVEPEILELETKLRELESSSKESVIRERIAKLEYEAAHPVPGALKMESPEQEILDLEEELHGLERKRKGIAVEENQGEEDSSRNEKLEREKLFQSQIENNSHPRAKKTKENLFSFIDSLERDDYNTPISDKFQLLKDELSEVLYRNDIEYAEDKEIKINEEDKVIVQPILGFRKEMDALNPLDTRALADYKDRLLGYMGNTFGMEYYRPKEGDVLNTKTMKVTKVHGTGVALLDQRIKKVVGSGYKFNDEFLEYYKESQAKNNKEMKEEWDSLKGTIPDEELNKIIDEDTKTFEKYSFPTGCVRPTKVETYSSTAHEEATQPQEDAKDTETIDADSGSREEKEEGKEKTQEATLDSRKDISDLRTELWKLRVGAESPDSSEGIELKIRDKEAELRALDARDEGTPKENREGLKDSVDNLHESNQKENVKRCEAGKEYLASRNGELDAEAKKSGLEGVFRWMGEKYNKLGWKSKLGVGAALSIGAATFTTVSMPIVFACMSGIAIQRVAGLASSFLKYEKKGKGKEGFWAGKEGAMLKAILYTAGMTAGMLYAIKEVKEGIDLARESTSWGDAVQGWLKHHYPFGHAEVATHGQAHTMMHDYETMKGMLGQEKPKISIDEMLGHNATNAISNEQIANMSADTMPDYSQMMPTDMDHVGISAPEVSAPEMPDISVEASTGHGYEWMMKRMYEQLNDASLDPEQYPEESDIRQLLDANDSTIDAVVHRIASNPDHGFFNPDGTSVQIDHDAYMTIDADGQINLDDAMHASPDAATTPEYHHPEAPVSHTNNMPAEGADTGSTEGVSGQKATPAEPPAEAPAAPAETKVPEAQTTPTFEHLEKWVNSNGVNIDPSKGEIYMDSSKKLFAYGKNAIDVAREYVTENQDAGVFVEGPVTDEGESRSLVFEVTYNKLLKTITYPLGLTNKSYYGTINTDGFTDKVWWRGIKFGESE